MTANVSFFVGLTKFIHDFQDDFGQLPEFVKLTEPEYTEFLEAAFNERVSITSRIFVTGTGKLEFVPVFLDVPILREEHTAHEGN